MNGRAWALGGVAGLILWLTVALMTGAFGVA